MTNLVTDETLSTCVGPGKGLRKLHKEEARMQATKGKREKQDKKESVQEDKNMHVMEKEHEENCDRIVVTRKEYPSRWKRQVEKLIWKAKVKEYCRRTSQQNKEE